MPYTDFPWPALPSSGDLPKWCGTGFRIGAGEVRLLAYGAPDSHWNDELTALHEDAAGRDHPIDRASRRLAIASMRRLAGRDPLRILDVGCSSGYLLDDLAREFPKAEPIASDFLRGPLEALGRRMAGLPILQFDLRRCPLPDGCVDGVACLNVLEHIDDDRLALRHLFRILKPGGIAHIEVPAGPGLYDIFDEHLLHHRRYRIGDLLRRAKEAGFSVESWTHLGFLFYPVFVALKLRNRRKLGLPAEEKARLAARLIRSTRVNPIVAATIRLETALGARFRLPCGIRCVAVLRKP